MSAITASMWAEYLKVRRSRILGLSLVAAIFMAAMMGLIMFVALNPDVAGKLGMFSAKASLVEDADWTYYFGMLSQIMAGAGAIVFGFVTAWVFGREYSDRTVKDLLALPVPRSRVVLAKSLVATAWCAILSLLFIVAGIAAGWAVGLPGWSGGLATDSIVTFAAVSFMTMLLSPVVAFLASYGRGYLPPIGFVILTIILSQFIGVIGLGPYFPWAVPGLFSVAGSGAGMEVGAVSYVILALTCLLGLAATFAWWRYADQH